MGKTFEMNIRRKSQIKAKLSQSMSFNPEADVLSRLWYSKHGKLIVVEHILKQDLNGAFQDWLYAYEVGNTGRTRKIDIEPIDTDSEKDLKKSMVKLAKTTLRKISLPGKPSLCF